MVAKTADLLSGPLSGHSYFNVRAFAHLLGLFHPRGQDSADADHDALSQLVALALVVVDSPGITWLYIEVTAVRNLHTTD